MSFTRFTSRERISIEQAKDINTYEPLGFQSTFWTTNDNTTFPKFNPEGFMTFGGRMNSRIKITPEEAKQAYVYAENNWDIMWHGQNELTPEYEAWNGEGLPPKKYVYTWEIIDDTTYPFHAGSEPPLSENKGNRYLLSVQGENGIIQLVAYDTDVSNVKIQTNDQAVCLSLVDVNAANASQVRIQTPDGIKAVEKG